MSGEVVPPLRAIPGFSVTTSHHQFTPLAVRNSEDGHFANRGTLENDRFNLAGINIFAACDDHVFQAVENIEIAVRF